MANTTQEFNFDVNVPYEEEVNWNTLVTRYEDGKEQRRQKWSRPKRVYSVALSGKSTAEMTRLWNFYNARSGAFDTFYFENPNESPLTQVIGSGDTVTTNFNLPNYPIPSGSITLSTTGASYTETTHYTLTRSTGAIVFNAGSVPTGDLTATYNFCRIVRFAEDKLNRELFNFKVYNSKLKLIEVLQ